MKNVCKVFPALMGVLFLSIPGYAATLECDTITGSASSIVYAPSLQCGNLTSSSCYFPGITLSPISETKAYLTIQSDVDSRKPLLSMSFKGDKYEGPSLSTNTRGYCVPINFEATEYFFKFTNGVDSDVPVGTMHVDGKIICKDELKVAEVNTDKIRAKDIDVDFNDAADYVFAEDYHLKPLREVEAYVKENKHLPGVPSADEFSNQGMNVSKMSNLLLEKVEELTLHIIQLQKEVEALKAANEALRNGK